MNNSSIPNNNITYITNGVKHTEPRPYNTSYKSVFHLCFYSIQRIINCISAKKIQPKTEQNNIKRLNSNESDLRSPEKYGGKLQNKEGRNEVFGQRTSLNDNNQSIVVRVQKQHSMESQIDSVNRHIYSRNVNKIREGINEENYRVELSIPDLALDITSEAKMIKTHENKKHSLDHLPKQDLPYEQNNYPTQNRNLIIYKNGIKRSYRDNNEKNISAYIKKSDYSNISNSIRQHKYSQKNEPLCNTPDEKSKNSCEKQKSEADSIDIVYDITTYIRCLFHDFRGPLNNISMGIDVLSQMISNINHSDITECNDMINNIHNSCEFMSSTLDGFLNLSQISDMNDVKQMKLTYTPFNIIGLIKKVQYLLMFSILEKKITIENKMSSDLEVWVLGDATHLQHVFYNILSNAVKFSKKNSKIIINLDTEKILGNIQKITISFIDENEPLPPHIKEKIFTLYNTSDNTTGTGLGLYICKKIIDLHKGKLYHEYTTNKSQSFHSGELAKNLRSPKSSHPLNSNKFIIELSLTICNNNINNTLSNNSSVKNSIDLNSPMLNIEDDQYYSIISLDGKNKLEQESNIESIIEGFAKSQEAQNGMKIGENNPVRITESYTPLNIIPNILMNSTADNSNTSNTVNTGMKIAVKDGEGENFHVNKYRIALVDDSDISRKLLNRLLLGHTFIKEHACKIYESIDGLDAISMLHNKIHNFSIIFMDNIMPSISGILASKILRGFGYKNLIFGITGNGLTEDIHEFIVNGADYVFIKPFKKEKLDMIFTFIKTYGISIPSDKKMIESEDKTQFILVDC